MTTLRAFSPGSLVRVRERDWLVLPGSTPELLLVRPIDGSEDESTGVLTALEDVEPAEFTKPDPEKWGACRECRLLRDAIRLNIRNGAGPFRSLGSLAFDPRPYQFVPLLLALRRNPVRILIADDVGVGKTIETAMILRELLDRGEIRKFCVVCPPYLAEQWQRELYDKFNLEAAVVGPSTVARLERKCIPGQRLFDVYPYAIVSIDFIKTERRREELLQAKFDAVVIDEAHAVAANAGASSRQLRRELARQLCADPKRNVILATATPHSGKSDAFRSLLGLLDEKFLDETRYPDDLSGADREKERRELAEYMVMRRRGDIADFLGEKTVFPTVKEAEVAWKLSPAYQTLFDKVMRYASEMVKDATGTEWTSRVRWWSALALLRSVASSPAAAAATLRTRGLASLDGEDAESAPTVEKIDELGAARVLDADASDAESVVDSPLGADCDPETLDSSDPRRKRLNALAKEADALQGKEKDLKLAELIRELTKLFREGYNPIVFCRFIPTANYVARELRKEFGDAVAIDAVTGELPPEERERRVEELGDAEKRVLVCTDCLSEGINLQESFDATIHYDLSWNPTRHEQREGRVNRFGQPKAEVRTETFYGKDDGIDGFVLEVLLRKHKKIKQSLGVSVPLPNDSESLVETMVKGLILRDERYGARPDRKARDAKTPLLPGIEEYLDATAAEKAEDIAEKLHSEWDAIARREEKRSQTFFAHRADSVRIVEAAKSELDDARRAVGSESDVKDFVLDALRDCHALVDHVERDDVYELNLDGVGDDVRDFLPEYDEWRVRFELPAPEGSEYVSRTHPLVAGLCDYVVGSALDPESADPIARRCGAIITRDVEMMQTLLLLRYRFHLERGARDGVGPSETLAEDVQIVAFEGAPDEPRWLDDAEIQKLLKMEPTRNIGAPQAKGALQFVLGGYEALRPTLDRFASERAEKLREAHERVRRAAKIAAPNVRPETPPDLVGVYVYLPDASD